MSTETITLYRPTGPRELALVKASGWRAWPPRLPEQPIFYPVLTEEYARKIARDWNATDERQQYRGYVTQFRVRADYLDGFDVHDVGASWASEYWIPAERRGEFNAAIVGPIEIIATYPGGAGAEPTEVPPSSDGQRRSS